jgi:hypothetical protein
VPYAEGRCAHFEYVFIMQLFDIREDPPRFATEVSPLPAAVISSLQPSSAVDAEIAGLSALQNRTFMCR